MTTEELIRSIRFEFIPLGDKLLDLYYISKEEDPEGPGINHNSVQCCINFFKNNSRFKAPMMSLTPDNDIYASYRGPDNQVFSIHFIDNDYISIVLFIKMFETDKELVRFSCKVKESVNEFIKGLDHFLNRGWIYK